MKAKKRLFVARLWYEGNAFCLQDAKKADFERREWRTGQAAIDAAKGHATELAAVADFQAHYSDAWEVVASRCASAQPSGPIEHALYAQFENEVLQDIAGQHWDAIYLSLHGAAITDQDSSPELRLVRAIKKLQPHTPIGASFDLHANIAPELPALLSISATYRTYPHIDMCETAMRCLENLRRTVHGEIAPVVAFCNSGQWLQSANMRTDVGPMADLQQLAMQHMGGNVIDIALQGGFPYSNAPQCGAAVWVWADQDQGAAQQVLERMMQAYQSKFIEFEPTLIAPAEGIAQALSVEGLVAVTDPADNPLSGGIGDTPELLRALLEYGADVPTVYASLADPAVVNAALALGVGGSMQVRLGGRLTPLYGAPVDLAVTVVRFTPGQFTNTGPMETGLSVECGPTVVLQYAQIQIIVTSHVAPCNDPAFFELHAIDLQSTRLLCVKAKNHFRAAFNPLCTSIVDIDAPGPAMLDLKKLKRLAEHAPASRTRS
ncbi:M81 family metallopeptidase [Lampropedia aestuarii]|uniref:M81 family metallopeptidase n=1 Tax=Lampropedia aestuarii TaxID=2562762 RepID=UPI0024694518|nr:M81 family metallopeptidase [Lampropedia aestuarii]MDH5857951.1 M81 family metallopeptidase [Lampropedia aestuarii]